MEPGGDVSRLMHWFPVDKKTGYSSSAGGLDQGFFILGIFDDVVMDHTLF